MIAILKTSGALNNNAVQCESIWCIARLTSRLHFKAEQ